jgi:hypothetical protein
MGRPRREFELPYRKKLRAASYTVVTAQARDFGGHEYD